MAQHVDYYQNNVKFLPHVALLNMMDQIFEVAPDLKNPASEDIYSSIQFAAPETIPFWFEEVKQFLRENARFHPEMMKLNLILLTYYQHNR